MFLQEIQCQPSNVKVFVNMTPSKFNRHLAYQPVAPKTI